MAYKTINQSIKRIDTLDKVTGAAIYPGDRQQERELWMKVLFARRPHARVVSIDIAEAEALPGVALILTAKDVPVNEYGLQIPDQPVLCGPGSTKNGGDVVRFVGDHVALVIAETEKIAAKARDLIRVTYEDLPIVDDPVAAMSEAAVQLHPDTPRNIAFHKRIRKGDVESVWADCDVIIEGVYDTPYRNTPTCNRRPARPIWMTKGASPFTAPGSGPGKTSSRLPTRSICRRSRCGWCTMPSAARLADVRI
jgi:CO/xanthine dehydrogenase Mo-binding subunit